MASVITPRKKERVGPYLIGLLPTAASYFLSPAMKSLVATQLANSVITVLAIIIAFVATSMTILLTVPDASKVNRIKGSDDAYRTLIGYHSEVVYMGIVAACLSLTVLIACRSVDSLLKDVLFFAWAYTVGVSFTSFLRVVRELHDLMQP